MELKIARHPILLEDGPEGFKGVFLRVSFRTQMAQHDDLWTRGALFTNMIKKPRRFLVFHMKPAIVIGVLLQKLRIVVGFHKEKVGIDAGFDKSFPVIEVRHDDRFAPDTVLATVNDESEIMGVGLMGDRYGAKDEFSDAKRPVREGAYLWEKRRGPAGVQVSNLLGRTLMTPDGDPVVGQNP